MTGPADLYKFKALLMPWGVRGIGTWSATGSAWHDGDTFNALVSKGTSEYRLTRVRCAGYNSPELKGTTKTAAIAARDHAASLVDAGSVVYLDSLAFGPNEEDDFGRMLAVVTLADGTDLAAAMISGGFATPDP